MSFDLGDVSASAPPRMSSMGYSGGGFGAFEDEPPLLEELGISIPQITGRTLTVLNPFQINPDPHEDADLSGPIIFYMLFGLCQLIGGKVHFGVILGWTTLASIYLYIVFNLLAGKNGSLDFYRCVSLVGYCQIFMVLLSAFSIFLPRGYLNMSWGV
nr:protein YIPF5 homolog [Physcomitrium patens]|eukprot:XP_024358849.1 protein YIPF5 homolog [Physcomitrella patens]